VRTLGREGHVPVLRSLDCCLITLLLVLRSREARAPLYWIVLPMVAAMHACTSWCEPRYQPRSCLKSQQAAEALLLLLPATCRKKGIPFVKEWIEIIEKDENVWDQNAFNDLFRRGVRVSSIMLTRSKLSASAA
jgi:hypothetical protein